jgi:drug/metabolite transporter (DMT)-like permease
VTGAAGLLSGVTAQPLAVALAATAALSFAVANVVQQRVAARLASAAAFDVAVLARLGRQRLWLAGLVMVIGSFALQAVALGRGRLVVIEPVLASSLLFALVLAARAERRRMRPGEWAAAVATFAGLATFLVAAQPSGGEPIAAAGPLGLAALAAVALAALCARLAARVTSARRALVLGLGGGVGAGVTDALTKSVAGLAGAHRFGVFADPRLYLLAVIGVLTYTMQQNGYRAAGLAAFLPTFAVLEPVVGSLLGLLIYHERLGGGPGRIALEVLAGLAATWGIARLAGVTAITPAPVRWRAEPLVPAAQAVPAAPAVQAAPTADEA